MPSAPRGWRLPATVLGLILIVAAASARVPAQTQTQPRTPRRADSSADEPGPRVYKGRPIADVMSYLGAEWLVRPDRESTEQPDKVLDALQLKPGDRVADVGCGVGYFTLRIARRVKPATVLAVEVQPEMIRMLKARMKAQHVSNIKPILGTATDPRLPAGQVDLVLMVDVYHEFSHPVPMMAAIRRALKPGGRCVLVEYRAEDPTVAIKPEHKMTLAQVKKEIGPMGFRFQTSLEFLPTQHIIIFTKPGAPARAPWTIRQAEPMTTDRGARATQVH